MNNEFQSSRQQTNRITVLEWHAPETIPKVASKVKIHFGTNEMLSWFKHKRTLISSGFESTHPHHPRHCQLSYELPDEGRLRIPVRIMADV